MAKSREKARLKAVLEDAKKGIEDALKELRQEDNEEQKKRRKQPKGSEQFRG